ncbi:hypothetical protein M0Q50_03825 [bacterium]|jgi:putative IMPACT (imprinted ancient) family translation regulator|nr:hypothetical protein [bacterium]
MKERYLNILKSFGFVVRFGDINLPKGACFIKSEDNRYTNVETSDYIFFNSYTNYRQGKYGDTNMIKHREGLKFSKNYLGDVYDIGFETNDINKFEQFLNDLFKSETRLKKLKSL